MPKAMGSEKSEMDRDEEEGIERIRDANFKKLTGYFPRMKFDREPDGLAVVATCIAPHKAREGELCNAAWRCELDTMGALYKGTYNSLMAHAAAHSGGFKRMERLR